MSEHARGDKVRIKAGSFAGQRGTLSRKESGQWRVTLSNEHKEICVDVEDLTNYSLAARRAWQSMPHRKVGRPLGSKVSDRLSVIFRVDRALWHEFVAAEKIGVVSDRTAVINQCLRSVLQAARRLRAKAS